MVLDEENDTFSLREPRSPDGDAEMAAPPTPGPVPSETGSEAESAACTVASDVSGLGDAASNATWDLVSHAGTLQQRLDRVGVAAGEEIRSAWPYIFKLAMVQIELLRSFPLCI